MAFFQYVGLDLYACFVSCDVFEQFYRVITVHPRYSHFFADPHADETGKPVMGVNKIIWIVLMLLDDGVCKIIQGVVVVDDGSTDHTVMYAKAFGKKHGLDIRIINRAHPIGKTPTIKRQSREFTADVEFSLDADTGLESPK